MARHSNDDIDNSLSQMFIQLERESMGQAVNSEHLTVEQNYIRRLNFQTEYLIHLKNRVHHQLAHVGEQLNVIGLAHRVPNELWEEIFTASIPDGESTTKRARQLLRFGAVCRRWRNVIHHASRLWAWLDNASCARFAQCMLERSGNSPLTVRSKKWIPTKIADLVVLRINRCKVITVEAGAKAADRLFRALLATNAAHKLEELSLLNADSRFRIRITQTVRLDAPRLRRLHIQMIHILLDQFLIHSPLLTHLSLEIHPSRSRPFVQYHRFLSFLPRLEELCLESHKTIHAIIDGNPQEQTISPIVLPNLKKLTFNYLPGSTISDLLRAIESPVCKEIHISFRAAQGVGLDPTLSVASFSEEAAISQLLTAPTSIEIAQHSDMTKLVIEVCQDAELEEDRTRLYIEEFFHQGGSRFAQSILTKTNLLELKLLKIRAVDAGDLVATLLRNMENLEHIHLHNSGNVDSVFKVLGTPLPTGSWPCPKLKIIAIKDGSKYTQCHLLKFLRFRYDTIPICIFGPIQASVPLTLLEIDYRSPGGLDQLDDAAKAKILEIVGKEAYKVAWM